MTTDPDGRSAADQQFVQGMKRLRRERHWSQTDVAEALKRHGWDVASQAIISKIEMGDRDVRLGEAYLIAQVFGSTVEAMAAPDEVHVLLRDLEVNTDRARGQIEAAQAGLESLRRISDHLGADVARARVYLSDRPESPHRAAIQGAAEGAEAALSEATSVTGGGDGEHPEDAK